jgi:hypothetical protein
LRRAALFTDIQGVGLQELLNNPFFQSSAAPFLVALVVAGLLFPLRLAGLAAVAGFLATVWLIGNFGFSPLTATRKLVVLGMAAPVLGVLADLAFKPTRVTAPVLGGIFGVASVWVFWSVLAQKPLAEGALLGAGVFALVAWTVALTVSLQGDPIRAGAAGLGLGLGVGIGAVLGASALLAQYGMALGAACGAFLLLVMILGKRMVAGTALTLPASVIAALLAAGALLLAQLPWTSLAALALVPVIVRLPLPDKLPAWLQAIIASIYAFVAAGAAWALAWLASRGTTA